MLTKLLLFWQANTFRGCTFHRPCGRLFLGRQSTLLLRTWGKRSKGTVSACLLPSQILFFARLLPFTPHSAWCPSQTRIALTTRSIDDVLLCGLWPHHAALLLFFRTSSQIARIRWVCTGFSHTPDTVRDAPFLPLLTDELSRMAALGVVSRPCVVRTASRNAVCILSHASVSRPLRTDVHTVGQQGTSGGNARQAYPPRTRDTMVVRISRIVTVRGCPPGFAGGSRGSRMLHAASVRSRGEDVRFRTAFGWGLFMGRRGT
jgi:hypothetical protein